MRNSGTMRWAGRIAVAVMIGAWATAPAAPPVFSLIPFRKIEADPQKAYDLAKEQGPWVVMAMSFSGEDAEAQARRLALEIRRDFQLPAYVHRQEYDYSQEVVGLGVDKFGNPKKMKYHNAAVVDEWAVVVGNFPSFEDPDAARTLERVRTLQPKSLVQGATPPRNGTVSLGMIREHYRKLTRDPEKKQRGPMGKAFLTRNPLLPKDDVAKGALDAFVKDLNDGVEHSLLGNRHRYTVQIATFRGVTAFNEREFNESVRSQRATPKIDQAALNAAKMAATLRKEGVEAYVFHDRYESIVTVGGFDALGNEDSNGRTELLPQIASVVKRFEAQRQPIPGSDQLGLIPKSIAGIPCDVSPRLIVVPRENLADVYQR